MVKRYKSHNKEDGLVVLWVKLWQKRYTRSLTSLYRVMQRLGIYKKTPSRKKQYVPNAIKNVQNQPNIVQNSQNNVQNALNFEKTGQNTSSELVETNIGKIPVEEYRDMMAQQAGFDDYTDMRKQGYKLGNKYDVDEATLKNQDTTEIAEKVKDLIYNNDDVYDSDIDKIVNDITGEEFKDADLDNDEVYDKYAERLEQLYEEVQSELENQGYIRNKNSYDYKDASYIPSSERLEQAKNDLNITYGERPSNTLQVKQMHQIRENIDDIISDIETPESISISKTESKSSADATYIDVYNEATDESKTIRVANHYKEGVSGKADYNIYISNYNTMEELNKAIEDTISKAQKATENTQTLQSKKITPSNDVDIMVESDYNEYKVTRKREPSNYVYKKITDKDRARVNSDYMLNKSKYDGKNFVHFSDVSYGYEINNGNIVILNKFKGSQKFINDVEEAWENGFDKISNGSIKVIESIRSAKRRSGISNGIDRGQQQGGTSNRKDTGYGRQQRNSNGTKTIKNNGDNLKNSEQSSFSLPKTDNTTPTNNPDILKSKKQGTTGMTDTERKHVVLRSKVYYFI